MWRNTGECIKHDTPGFLCIFCYFYGENTSYNKVFWCFQPIFTNLWSCMVLNNVSLREWRNTREWAKKKYVNYALHVGFWNCLYMSFCFMMKKDHSKQKLLLWPQVPLKTNLDSNGFLFLNKIYSSLADEKKRADELEGSILFSYGKTNFCRITIGYIGNNKVDILDEKWTFFSIRC